MASAFCILSKNLAYFKVKKNVSAMFSFRHSMFMYMAHFKLISVLCYKEKIDDDFFLNG